MLTHLSNFEKFLLTRLLGPTRLSNFKISSHLHCYSDSTLIRHLRVDIKVIPWTARASSRSKKSLLLFWFALLLGSSEYFLYPISSFLQLSKTKIQLCTPSIVWPCSNSILTVCDKTLRKRLKELSLVVPCR